MQSTARTAPYGHACVNCARAKCRCVTSGVAGRGCERCHRLGKECHLAPKTRQRKGPSRTELLEKKVDDLMALLKNKEPSQGLPIDLPNPSPVDSMPLAASRAAEDLAILDTISPPTQPSLPSTVPEFSADEQEGILTAFQSEKLPWLPFMHIPATMGAAEFQEQSPFTWLCITAVQSKCTEHTAVLCDRAREVAGRKFMLNCEKSMDLLQGALVYLAWITFYCPSEKTSLCSYIQMAIAMVYNLRLHKPPPPDPMMAIPACNVVGHMALRKPAFTSVRTMNERRAVLGCYLLSSSIAQFVGVMEPLQWTSHMAECLEVLATSKETPNDAILVQLVSMRLIADKIEQGTGINSEPTPITRAPYAWHVTALESQLADLTNRIPSDLLSNQSIMLCLLDVKVSLYETALANPPDRLANDVDVRRLDHLYTCLSAVKEFTDILLSCSPASLFNLSMSMIMQISHCFIVLFRLSVFEYPGWDRAAVRRDVDLISLTTQLSEKMGQIASTVGITNDGPLVDSGTRFSRILQRLVVGWASRMSDPTDGDRPPTAEPVLATEMWYPDLFTDTSWLSGAFMSGAFSDLSIPNS